MCETESSAVHSLSGRCQGSDPGHLAPRGGHEQTQRRARAAAGDRCARDRHGPHTTPHRDSRAPPARKLERHRPLRGDWEAPAFFGPWTDADLEAVHGVWPRAENLKSAQSALRWGGGASVGGSRRLSGFRARTRGLEPARRRMPSCATGCRLGAGSRKQGDIRPDGDHSSLRVPWRHT